MREKVTIVWHRRDLRLTDNAAAYYALANHQNVLPIFVFDKQILEKLPPKDRRVTFIHQQVEQLQQELEKLGSTLRVFFDYPNEVLSTLSNEYEVDAVYTNRDYEPYAKERDEQIEQLLSEKEIPFYTYKDQCIFEKDEIVKADGDWYSVYSPYARKWKEKLNDFYQKSYPNENYFNNYIQLSSKPIPSLASMGFEPVTDHIPPKKLDLSIVKNYHKTRDIPSIQGTTHISVHLRFGTLSIRKLVREAIDLNEKWLNELIWRDFYMMILHFNPQVTQLSFKPKYDRIEWRNNEEEFDKWCKGKTGYPIVDAGMRELNETGFMHNRVRMITASFLVKHLLIDWRWGEAYFAEKLLDFELSSNNGGWQWASSSGCDAAPYFRVFNPELQTKKFDPDLKYVKKWVPEFNELSYQQSQVVEHKFARERVLSTYKKALDTA